VAQALRGDEQPPPPAAEAAEERVDLVVSYSEREVLRQKDFADFTAEEIAAAREGVETPEVEAAAGEGARSGRVTALGGRLCIGF